MKKVLIICMLLISVGILSGCIEDTLEDMTFDELVAFYEDSYPESEVVDDSSSWSSDITLYLNCTFDIWFEWYDNLTDSGRAQTVFSRLERTKMHETTDRGRIRVFYRFINESYETYTSAEEKYIEEINNEINLAYNYKNEVIGIIEYNDIKEFERAFDIVTEIFLTSIKMALHDNDSIQANKSMNIFFDFRDNITKLQSLIWQNDTFRSFLSENLTNETKNLTAITAFFVDYLFDQISDLEDGKIYAFGDYGSELFNFTSDGVNEAISFIGGGGSIRLPAGSMKVTSTIIISNMSYGYISGDWNDKTILYIDDDFNDSVVFDITNMSNTRLSHFKIMFMNSSFRPTVLNMRSDGNKSDVDFNTFSYFTIGQFPFPLVSEDIQ